MEVLSEIFLLLLMGGIGFICGYSTANLDRLIFVRKMLTSLNPADPQWEGRIETIEAFIRMKPDKPVEKNKHNRISKYFK